MSPAGKVTAWALGGLAGAAVATVAALAARQHGRIGELRRRAVEAAASAADSLGDPPNREYQVSADDGLTLSVEEVDPAGGGTPELTVVLVHDYTLDRRAWSLQRPELARATGPRVRQVLYDHRGHGRSARSPRQRRTLAQLGLDLGAVIRAAAPEGRVVLVGHSLGGMTVMALAEHDPDLFRDRVCGVAFLNTSAGDIGREGLPRPVLSRHHPATRAVGLLAARHPQAIEWIRARTGHLIWSLIRQLAFGDQRVDPVRVELLDTIMRQTAVEVMADFLPTLDSHNRYAALAGLQYVRALVIGAGADELVQFEHSEEIAALMPDAELVHVAGAGHMTMLEQPELVNKHLLDLLAHCSGRRGRAQSA